MPPQTAPAAAGREPESQGSSTMKSLLQGVAIFMAVQFLMGKFMGSSTPASTTTTDASGNVVTIPANTGDIPAFIARPDSLDNGAMYNPIPQRIAPIWAPESELDITVVVSPSFATSPLSKVPADRIVVQEKAFKPADGKDKRVIDTSFKVPKEVQNNGTLWGHFYIGLAGSNLDPTTQGYNTDKAYHFIHPLTQYLAKKRVRKTKSLLGAANTTEVQEEEPIPKGTLIQSFYHPNFTMSIIPDSGVMSYPGAHPAVRQYLKLESTGARDGSGQNGWYYPILFVNTFWQLRTHMTELNNTVTTLPFHVDLNTQNNWLFGIVASIDEGAKQTARQAAQGQKAPGGGDGSEFEMFKTILLDSNIYLLGTTAVVSILHMVFEMLAFSSDIRHFRNKKDNVGISVRSILGNVFMQLIIFLYLMDNNENTSWMILFGQAMGIVLEFWKITKVVNVRLRAAPDSLIPYRIAFEDKHKLSETEQKTQEYDAVAFKYMYFIAVPLLLAYGVYSLVYDTHKSWYSFIIATLVGSVYAYGFLMMVPSLYINYRLKSVAHMPAKAMTYKFLNTFIDDLFAFTIKMPTLHRLATLRDDVIFFVYLYQSYKYKVDYTRVNEFGQGGDEEQLEEKMAARPLVSSAGADASVGVGLEGAEKAEKKLDELVGEKEVTATGMEKKSPAKKRK